MQLVEQANHTLICPEGKIHASTSLEGRIFHLTKKYQNMHLIISNNRPKHNDCYQPLSQYQTHAYRAEQANKQKHARTHTFKHTNAAAKGLR